MAPRSRGVERIAQTFVSNSSTSHICRSCRQALFRRSYASAATAQVAEETHPVTQNNHDLNRTAPTTNPQVHVNAGIVLSRPPLITPDPHPFETAYHLYQRRLNQRLVLPFTQYFYYKRGTPAFEQWRTKRRERGGAAARDVGKYDAYSEEAWNDEVIVGDESANPRVLIEKLVEEEGRATEFVGETGDLKTAGLKRTTEADKMNDQRSLERRLSRTLYLLVKPKSKKGRDENWTFPSGSLEGKEGLKEAAQRILGESCGVNMNTWFVGNHPIGHFVAPLMLPNQISATKELDQSETKDSRATQDAADISSDKTFFMKARILAGQADVNSTNKNYEDFQWLSKDEIKERVNVRYWSKIKNMLVEQ